MTDRLYYTDSYLREFEAQIAARSGDGLTIYLDRTAFYPTSGGQPFDVGTINGGAVVDVVDEDDRIAHRLAAPVAGDAARCAIDWTRRFDHMQQHTGQHLLSAVFDDLFGLKTVSFHMGADSSTIDLEGAAVDARVLREAERRANEIIFENRKVSIRFQSADDVEGLRKRSEREGTLRIIEIDGLDTCACGGTHVRATGEIGALLLRKFEKVRQATRVEFLCGGRAVRRAHADYEALSKSAQFFSSPLDEVPALVSAQLESAKSNEKARRKLELDIAVYQGKELYDSTSPDTAGTRRTVRRLARGGLEDMRAVAQSFTAQSKAVFLGVVGDPPSVLLAVSADIGIDAGKIVKSALSEAGGRGGGTPRVAQGSVSNAGDLERVVDAISRAADA